MIIFEPKKRDNNNFVYADRQRIYDCYVKYNLEQVSRDINIRETNARNMLETQRTTCQG